jgi:hypothetical protein
MTLILQREMVRATVNCPPLSTDGPLPGTPQPLPVPNKGPRKSRPDEDPREGAHLGHPHNQSYGHRWPGSRSTTTEHAAPCPARMTTHSYV